MRHQLAGILALATRIFGSWHKVSDPKRLGKSGRGQTGWIFLILMGLFMTSPSTIYGQVDPATLNPVSGRSNSIEEIIPADVLARLHVVEQFAPRDRLDRFILIHSTLPSFGDVPPRERHQGLDLRLPLHPIKQKRQPDRCGIKSGARRQRGRRHQDERQEQDLQETTEPSGEKHKLKVRRRSRRS